MLDSIILLFSLFVFLVFLCRKVFTKKRVITHSTTIMITGAANGIGKIIAENFATHHRCIFVLVDILDGA